MSHDFSLVRLVNSESMVVLFLVEVEFAMVSDVIMEHCPIKIIIAGSGVDNAQESEDYQNSGHLFININNTIIIIYYC